MGEVIENPCKFVYDQNNMYNIFSQRREDMYRRSVTAGGSGEPQ